MTRALAGAGFVALSLGALGQPASERLAFEVASVRLNNTDVQPSVGPAPGGQRFMARNMPLNWLIAMAYGVSIRRSACRAHSMPSATTSRPRRSGRRVARR
jgi:hypothetical protein